MCSRPQAPSPPLPSCAEPGLLAMLPQLPPLAPPLAASVPSAGVCTLLLSLLPGPSTSQFAAPPGHPPTPSPPLPFPCQVKASQTRLQNKYQLAQSTADDWYRRAELALGKGDEELAREALTRRKSFQVPQAAARCSAPRRLLLV
jgi:hypothetical protein